MFESVTSDPGEDAIRRASRIFFVIAVLGVIGTVLTAVLALTGKGLDVVTVITLALYLLMSLVAWLTGRGIEDRKKWAKWLGIALGLLELVNFPIGTVIGVAILVYLNRAFKTGVFFNSPAPAAQLAPAADPARLAVAWQSGYHFASRAGPPRRRSVGRRSSHAERFPHSSLRSFDGWRETQHLRCGRAK